MGNYVYNVLCDHVDEARIIPKVGMRQKQVTEVSAYNWAQEKLLEEIRKNLEIVDGSDFEPIIVAEDISVLFINRMVECSLAFPKSREQFRIAAEAAGDILDILAAME